MAGYDSSFGRRHASASCGKGWRVDGISNLVINATRELLLRWRGRSHADTLPLPLRLHDKINPVKPGILQIDRVNRNRNSDSKPGCGRTALGRVVAHEPRRADPVGMQVIGLAGSDIGVYSVRPRTGSRAVATGGARPARPSGTRGQGLPPHNSPPRVGWRK